MFEYEKAGQWRPFDRNRTLEGKLPFQRISDLVLASRGFKTGETFIERIKHFFATRMLLGLGYSEALSPLEGAELPPAWQRVLQTLYSEGVITTPNIRPELEVAGTPHLYLASLEAKFDAQKTDGLPDTTKGVFARGMSAVSLEEALSKMVGEFLERYPLLYYKRSDFVRASSNHLKKKKVDHIDLTFLPSYSPAVKEQNPKLGWDSDTVFEWVSVQALSAGKTVLVPAQLIFWNYQTAPSEARLAESTTNGAAGMFTEEEAIFSGLAELLQRDAFLNHWLTHTPSPRIDPSSIHFMATKELLASCARYGLEVILLDTTLDTSLFTTVAFILDRSGKGPAVVCGGGGGKNSEEAVLKSLTEAVGVRLWQGGLPLEIREQENKTIPSSPLTRSLFWSPLSMIDEVSWLFSGKEMPLKPTSLEDLDIGEALNVVRSELKEKGEAYETCVYASQHPLLKKFGYYGVKVVVPALTPLYFSESYAPLASKRIQALREKGLLSKGAFNTTPHPFP